MNLSWNNSYGRSRRQSLILHEKTRKREVHKKKVSSLGNICTFSQRKLWGAMNTHKKLRQAYFMQWIICIIRILTQNFYFQAPLALLFIHQSDQSRNYTFKFMVELERKKKKPEWWVRGRRPHISIFFGIDKLYELDRPLKTKKVLL